MMKDLNTNCLTVRDRIYVAQLQRAGLPIPSHLVREMKGHAKALKKARLRRARKTQSALYGNMTCFI